MNTSRLAHWGGPTLSATACLAVFGLAYFAVPNSSSTMKPSLSKATPSVGSHLLAEYAKRTAKSCEPIAPIQTDLRFETAPVPGIATMLNFDAMTMEAGPNAEIDFDVPDGISVVTGNRRSTGNMVANQPYRFSVAVRFDRPGSYEIAAQAIVGQSNYRFGRRNRLYAEFDGSNIVVTTTPPAKHEVGGPPVRGRDDGQTMKSRTDRRMPDAVDPNGNIVSGGAEGSDTTITGQLRYWRDYGAIADAYAWAYGSNVQAWDEDGAADDFLGVAACNSIGEFSISFDNDTDDVFSGFTADVYLRFRSTTGSVAVENAANAVYEGDTAVLFTNITNGTHDTGLWTYDSTHAHRRAHQVLDDGVTAWAKGSGDLGHATHLTHIRWYAGSVDGSYYVLAENRIYFEDSDVSSPDVLMHEYGHSFHDSIYGDAFWPPGTGGAHSFTGHYTNGLALTEGYATYYSCISQGDDWIYNSYDPGNLITFDCDSNWDGNTPADGNVGGDSVGAGNMGYDTESAVLSFYLDLDDTRNSTTDPYDWSFLDDDEIHAVMDTYLTGGHPPYSIQEFFDGYHAQGHPYEPKINAQMYIHGMNQGISYPVIGLYSGIDLYTGTWYYGGNSSASYEIKNYRSNSYDLNQCYIWLTGPGGEDIGQIGGDGNGAPLASGAVRLVSEVELQTGYNPAAPNFIYGLYRVRAGHYDTANTWHLLDPSEVGADRDVNVTVVEDLDGPASVNVVDDGTIQTSLTNIHIVATSNDFDSSIEGYWTSVGTAAGAIDVQGWVFHPANNDPSFDYTITGLALTEGGTYYVNVYSRNIEGLLSPLDSTDGITVNSLLFATAFTLGPGSTVSNGISNLTASNDVRWNIRPTAVLVSTQDPIALVLEAVCPYATLSDLDIQIESRATTANIVEKLQVYNWDTASYTTIDTRTLTTTDVSFLDDAGVPGPLIDNATNKVRMRLLFKASAAVLVYPWQAQLDRAYWVMTQ